MLILLTVLLFAGNLASIDAARAKNDCHLKQLDACLEKVEKVSNDPNSQELLKTEAGVKQICAASLETANCMEEAFKKCATPTHRELFKFFNDHFLKSMSAFCDSKEQIQKFTSESTCIVDKVLKKQDYKSKCVTSYLATLDKMEAQQDTSVKINTACCSYNRWENCMYTLIVKECGTTARESAALFFSNALGVTSKGFCNDASFKYTSKRCTKLYAPANATSKGKNSDNPITKYILSYVGFLFQ